MTSWAASLIPVGSLLAGSALTMAGQALADRRASRRERAQRLDELRIRRFEIERETLLALQDGLNKHLVRWASTDEAESESHLEHIEAALWEHRFSVDSMAHRLLDRAAAEACLAFTQKCEDSLRNHDVERLSVAEIGWDHQEFAIYVWRSVRASGDTKTEKSRRSLQLPEWCVAALADLWKHQAAVRERAGERTANLGRVFATRTGGSLSAGNVRREFRRVIGKVPGLVASEWTPREMRHSFVSALSANGVAVEEISRLVGHKGGSAVTEKVYRQEIRPVIQEGATAMDRIFPREKPQTQSGS